MWPHLNLIITDFTRETRGIRMSGAAASNLCHLAEGVTDAYWQFNLKVRAGPFHATDTGASRSRDVTSPPPPPVHAAMCTKPWDVAAGVLIAEEAGARVSTADGTAYSVFDRQGRSASSHMDHMAAPSRLMQRFSMLDV